jgi:hypothetical protein
VTRSPSGGIPPQKLDFIWSGDLHPTDWAAANSHMWVGHYMPMNVLGDGTNPHCQSDSDCLVSWVQCTGYAPSPAPRTCQPVAPPACSSCPANTECGNDGLCALTVDAKRRIEFNYWQQTHPDWLVYKYTTTPAQDYTHVAWPGNGWAAAPLDFTNPSVLAALLQRERGVLTPASSFTTLSMDIVFLANYYLSYATYKSGVYTPLSNGTSFTGNPYFVPANPLCQGTGNQGYCDWPYSQAVLTWLTRWRDEMHKLGINLVINLGAAGANSIQIPSSDPLLSQAFDAVDGVLEEGGFTRGGLTYPSAAPQCTQSPYQSWTYDGVYQDAIGYGNGAYCTSQSVWSDEAGYQSLAQSKGKPFFNKNAFAGCPLAPAPSPSPTANDLNWALASFELAGAPNAAIYVTCNIITSDGSSADPEYNWDLGQLSASLGTATGPRVDNNNLHTRAFTQGFVAANAAPYAGTPPADSLSVTLPWLPAGNTFHSYDHSQVFNPGDVVSLPPQQGLVLYSTASLTSCNSATDCPSGLLCSAHVCTQCGVNAPCDSGCCSLGQCVAGDSNNACGMGGGMCKACRPGTSCDGSSGNCIRCFGTTCS